MSDEDIHKTELELQRMKLQRSYRNRLALLQAKRRGAEIVYANQKEAALAIIQAFMEGKVWVVLVAPPGAGKTGVILEVLRLLGQHCDEHLQIHIKNMLLITGMSDMDWVDTMKDGMLEDFHGIIHHRGQFNKKVSLETMRDGIIVTDECHVACQENQTIDKKLKAAHLKNIDTLRARNMRMLDVSATPEGVLYDLRSWREHTAVVVLQPDENYQGFQKMKDEGRLRSAADYDLEDPAKARELLQLLQDRYKDCPSKKYFAFRVYSLAARKNVADACAALGWTHADHDSANRVEDIDRVMESAPTTHKVFFVKGFWRASKRLVRKHVGGTYESITSRPDDTAKGQGLTARGCSTFVWEGEQTDVNLRPLHFDDVESIDRYLEWTRAGYDYKEAAYKAPRLRADGEGHVKAPRSKVHPSGVMGVDAVDEDPVPAPIAVTPPRRRAAPTQPRATNNYHRASKEFPTAEAAKSYYIATFESEVGYASKLHKCKEDGPNKGKLECSFPNVAAGVHSVEVVRSKLGTGNLWGANQNNLKGASAVPRVGTLKVGYTGDVPTFFLCVCSTTPVTLP